MSAAADEPRAPTQVMLCINEDEAEDAQASAEFLVRFMEGMTKFNVGGMSWVVTVDGAVVGRHPPSD